MIDLGLDTTALVQEYIPADGGRIVRVEVLNGRYLYAIRVYSDDESFNLCPADVCQGVDGAELARPACAADAPKNNLRVEGFTPPVEISQAVERIMRASGIELVGFDPFARLADWLEAELLTTRLAAPARDQHERQPAPAAG